MGYDAAPRTDARVALMNDQPDTSSPESLVDPAAPEPVAQTPAPTDAPAELPSYWLAAGGGRPADKPRGRFGRLAWLIGIGAAVVGTLGFKILFGVVAGTVATTAFGAAFVGPWQHLPADVRSSYEARLQTAVGDQTKGMSQSQVADRVETMVQHGLARLDDQTLVRHLTLEVAGLDKTDVKTCAAFGRASISGQAQSADVAQKLIGALDPLAYQEFVGINIAGIEAEARQAPPAQPSDPSASAILRRLVDTFP